MNLYDILQDTLLLKDKNKLKQNTKEKLETLTQVPFTVDVHDTD